MAQLLFAPLPDFPLPPRPSQGVVPYLGTFLKDLVMLDAATRKRLEVSVPGRGGLRGWGLQGGEAADVGV